MDLSHKSVGSFLWLTLLSLPCLATPFSAVNSLKPEGGFVKNEGQYADRVLFRTDVQKGTIWVTSDSLWFDWVDSTGKRVSVREKFRGTKGLAAVVTGTALPGVMNYLRTDALRPSIKANTFSEVTLRDLWPGISLRLYKRDSFLEQEFIVAAGADSKSIQIEFEGAEKLGVDASGALLIETGVGQVRESAPIAFQQIGEKKVNIAARFQLTSEFSYTFDIDNYSRNHELVIDPTLSYSTLFGGSRSDTLQGVATDSIGNIYVAGSTRSLDIPSTPGTAITDPSNGARAYHDAIVSKFDPSGKTLIHSTLLGGAGGATGERLAVSSDGEVYLLVGFGSVRTTSNAFRRSCLGPHLAKLNTAGDTLLYSTCVPGLKIQNAFYDIGMAIDGNGRAVVVGWGPNEAGNPITTPNAAYPRPSPIYDPNTGFTDAYFAVFDTRLSGDSSLVYASYLPGRGYDVASAAAFDSSGNLFIAGATNSPDFPVSSNAYQKAPNFTNAFVSKFDISKSGSASLLSSTLLGGSKGVRVRDLAVDRFGNPFLTGYVYAGFDNTPFPTTADAVFKTERTAGGFVAKFKHDLSALRYSTFLSSIGNEEGMGIAIDEFGNAVVGGTSYGGGMSTSPDAFQRLPKVAEEAFFLILNATGSQILYSTLLGGSARDFGWGIALDTLGNAIVVGQNGYDLGAASADFPVTSDAYQKQPKGTIGQHNANWEGFIAKFDRGNLRPPTINRVIPSAAGNAGPVTLTIHGDAFRLGMTASAECAGGGTRTADKIDIGQNGSLLMPRFNFVGVSPGACSLSLRNSDGSRVTGAFQVVAGGAPDVRISKAGTLAVPGRVLDYFITVENRGNVDGNGVLGEIIEPWYTFLGANPPPARQMTGEDIFQVPPKPSHIAHLVWQYSVSPGQTRVYAYKARLDADVPFGVTVHGLACKTPNQEQADILIMLYEACKAEFRYPLPRAQREAGIALCAEKIRKECEDGSSASAESITGGPKDPNEKLVSHGRFIRPDQTLTYPIHYENIGNAEARDIFLTDSLDTNLDEATLQLLTPGATYTSTNRMIKWSLYDRNLLPKATDNVLLSIRPKPNLPSGTMIRNKATIQFEVFETITTNETVNIIDTTRPNCLVNPLPAQTRGSNLKLSWTGTDAVGEVDTQTIFMSVDNGAYTPLLTNTKLQTNTVQGAIGKTYRFYCTAVDTVGNTEIQSPTAEATTTLVSSTPPPVPGDVNADGVVNCLDLSILMTAFGKKAGEPGFNVAADVVKDNIIDVRDRAFVSQRLPAGTRCN